MSLLAQIRVILGVFAVLVVISLLFSSTFPAPAPWLEAWVKLFATVIGIIAALKAAWTLPELVQALRNR
jgi:hypothetical protein